jgi:hypothetical protein
VFFESISTKGKNNASIFRVAFLDYFSMEVNDFSETLAPTYH